MDYEGVVIEESLADKTVLESLDIVFTRIEPVTKAHKTPWLKQWTLHTVKIGEAQTADIAEKFSQALDPKHSWYIDYRNTRYHYVIFKDKVFKLDRSKKSDYEQMVAYGLSIGTPDYQLPNFSDLPIDVLNTFLQEAHRNTYADAAAQRLPSLRPSSKDYHFGTDELSYHDTYFGATKFIGEEVVYKAGRPAWGMNYYGFTLDSAISEGLYDAVLRPALLAGADGPVPVRGPKEFVRGDWSYTFKAEGDLANFTGTEEISRNGTVVCRLYCHGGFIE